MATYDPKKKRSAAAEASVADAEVSSSQVDALLGEPEHSEVASGVAPSLLTNNDVAASHQADPEKPTITVTVAQSPVEPAGPPGPGIARVLAAGAAATALLGGVVAWRKRSHRKR